MLRDLIEDYLANKRPTVSQVTVVVGLMRRIAQCQKTEYASKFVELIQGILGLLNQKGGVDQMQLGEQRLLQ